MGVVLGEGVGKVWGVGFVGLMGMRWVGFGGLVGIRGVWSR